MGVMEIPNDSKVIRAPRRNTNTSAMVTKMEVVGKIVWARLAYRVAKPPTMRAATNIAKSKTKAKSPQTNGICERFHRTILNEFYRVTFRKKIYNTIEELQADLDSWIREYNSERTHSGKFCYGKTPMQTFLDSKHIADEKTLDLIRQPKKEYREEVSDII